MKNIFYFFIFLYVNSSCSNNFSFQERKESNYLKRELSLSNKNLKKIKNDEKIITELILSIKDSIIKKKASSILDSFFLERYSREKLITVLELNRVFKGSNYRIIDKKEIDSTKALIINDFKNLNKLKEAKYDIKLKTKIKDSLKERK